MKKLIYSALALAGLLFAASCQQENLEPVQTGNTVTLTVNVPDVVTKVVDDGSNVNNLVYAVYRTTGTPENDVYTTLTPEKLVYQKAAKSSNSSWIVPLELINDQDYVVLFWAQVENAWIADNYAFGTEGVGYPAGLTANADKYAAFSGRAYLPAVDQSIKKSITLQRAVAQINVATSLTKEYTVELDKSEVTVANVGQKFNVATQKATGNTNVTFSNAAVPTGKVTVNDTEYTYAAMNYVFANGNVNVTYDIATKSHGTVNNTIDNVPVAANYRTNIVGNLLTSDVQYTITLDDWAKVEYVGPEFVEQPAYDADTKTWTVTNASQLAWVAASVNGTIGVETRSAETKENFKGEIVKLDADIDLENKLWTPIGTVLGESRYTYGFAGTFDGNGKTIKNLKVDHADCAGLFGNMCGGTIKNLTIDGFDLNSDHYAGAILGWGETGANPIVIENCKALNGKIKVNVIEKADGSHDLGDKAGAIVGFSHHGIYTGNEAQNVEIVGYRDLGGIVGYGKNTIVKNCKVTEVTLRQDLTIDYKKNEENESTPTTLDDYIGRKGGTCTIEGNEGTVTKNTNVLVEGTEEKTATQVFAETLANIVEGDVINVAADVEITLPYGLNAANAETITIAGSGESSVLSGTLNQHGNNQQPGNYAERKHLVFKDITYKTANNGYAGGFGHAASVTFINCKIIGQMYAHSNAPHYFYDCTIDPLNGYLYTYASDCVFEGCTFEASEGKALQVYGEADVECDVTIKDCTFKAAKHATTWDGKDVTGIDINSANNYRVNVTVTNCTTTGFLEGPNSGSELYNIKDGGVDKVNLVIDGKYIVRRGYTAVAGYPNLYVETATSEYHVFDLDGLKDLHDFFFANRMANSTWGKTYNISADIDADGYTWEGIWMNTGSSTSNGLILDGNNHTIENLTIKDYMLAANPTGTVETSTPGEVRNITMKNVTVNGSSHDATVFWGNCHGNVNFTNVTVDGAKISGGSNVGALMSRTTIDGSNSNIVVNFTNCKVINSTLKADNPNADPNGASGFIGRAYGATKLSFSGCSEENNTIINENGLVGGKVYGYTTWYGDGFKGTGSCDQFKNWEGISFETVATPEEMKDVLTAAGQAGAGNTTILFEGNIDMTGEEWTPIKVDGYRGAGVVVIDGNDAVITGLTSPLFAGGFAGGSGIVIRNLTIADSDIVSTNTIGSGAFIDSIDSMPEITLENCHLLNSTVTGGPGSRTGGLIGWTAGYNNQNDGPVKTYVKINNCSVVGSTIQCDGSVGAIYGHAGNNAWTFSTVENCTVKDCTLNSTDDGGWRVGVVVGTANVGELKIKNITESGNTLTQTGKTAPTGEKRNYYGRFVPGSTGKLVIDGVEVTE